MLLNLVLWNTATNTDPSTSCLGWSVHLGLRAHLTGALENTHHDLSLRSGPTPRVTAVVDGWGSNPVHEMIQVICGVLGVDCGEQAQCLDRTELLKRLSRLHIAWRIHSFCGPGFKYNKG